MMLRRSPSLALVTSLIASAVLFGAPAISRAQQGSVPRTVVLRFEGWHAEQARRAALQGLSAYELIEEAALIDTAARIGVDVSTPEGMASVVENMGVTLVVGGFIEGTGRRSTTTVWVMDVRGNELSRRTTSGPTGRAAYPDIATAAGEASAEAIAVLNRPPPEPEPGPEAPPDDMMEEAPPDEGEPVDISGRWNQPLVRALVGLRIRNRSASVTPRADLNRFDAEFFPDIQLMAEVRPLARAVGAERGLYFALSGGFSAGMTYAQQDGDLPSMQTFNFEVDAGYGLVLAEMVELVFSVGFGIDGFDLADATLTDFPSTMYSFLRPAIQGRIRILPDSLLVAELGVGGRIVFDAGQIGSQDRFGPEGTTAGGVDFFLGLAGQLDIGFSWAARFAYTSYFLGFNGGVEQSTGTDEAVQIWLMVGWSF